MSAPQLDTVTQPDAQHHLKSTVSSLSAAAWAEIIGQFSDANIYQSSAYGSVRWGASNLSHLLVTRNGTVVAAAQLRIAKVPLLPAGVAYLRWGPMCQRKGEALDPSVVEFTLAALKEEYGKRRNLSLQVIPSVFHGTPRGDIVGAALLKSALKPDADTSHYKTVVVDLTPAPEAIRKRLDQKWRNQLNGSEKNALTFESSQEQTAYAEFLSLYHGMMERKQFETSVDVHEFARIQELLPPDAKMQIFLARKEGRPVAALVCSLMGDTAIYLLGATNDEARSTKAAYFLHWQAMLWLREHGAANYDLGGIDAVTNPGGHHFKSGFGGREADQIRSHVASPGAIGDAVMGCIRWLKKRKNRAKAAPEKATA